MVGSKEGRSEKNRRIHKQFVVFPFELSKVMCKMCGMESHHHYPYATDLHQGVSLRAVREHETQASSL
jgi:hypothetical protein